MPLGRDIILHALEKPNLRNKSKWEREGIREKGERREKCHYTYRIPTIPVNTTYNTLSNTDKYLLTKSVLLCEHRMNEFSSKPQTYTTAALIKNAICVSSLEKSI